MVFIGVAKIDQNTFQADNRTENHLIPVCSANVDTGLADNYIVGFAATIGIIGKAFQFLAVKLLIPGI